MAKPVTPTLVDPEMMAQLENLAAESSPLKRNEPATTSAPTQPAKSKPAAAAVVASSAPVKSARGPRTARSNVPSVTINDSSELGNKTFSLVLPVKWMAALDHLARVEERSVSFLVRKGLEQTDLMKRAEEAGFIWPTQGE